MSDASQFDLVANSSDDEKEIMERNWKKNISEIETVAFRDGATSTEHKSDVMFQMGFDKGYKDGFKDGYQKASYKSTHMLLNKFNITEDSGEKSNQKSPSKDLFVS